MRQLRSDLAAALRRAAAGEELVVTVSGAAVARLSPVTRSDAADADRDEVLRLLVASGAVVAPRRTGALRPIEPLQLVPHPRLDLLLRDVRS